MSPAKRRTRTRSYRAMANVAPNGVGMVYDQVEELEETDEVKAMVERELLEPTSGREARGSGVGDAGSESVVFDDAAEVIPADESG